MADIAGALKSIVASLFHLSDAHEQMAAVVPGGPGAIRVAINNAKNALNTATSLLDEVEATPENPLAQTLPPPADPVPPPPVAEEAPPPVDAVPEQAASDNVADAMNAAEEQGLEQAQSPPPPPVS